jgi:Flp pilus assembly protein TadG
MITRTWRLRRRDEGAVAIIVAMLTLVIFAVSALVVDIGQVYTTRRSLQSAVDLAALAGAQELPKKPTVACQTAIDYFNQNTPETSYQFTTADRDSCTDTGTPDGRILIDKGNTEITVNSGHKTVDFGFANAIGISNGGTAATATAAIASPFTGVQPFSVATSTEYGYQCIKDLPPGQTASPLRAALLPMGPTPSVTAVSPTTIPVGEAPTLTWTGSHLNSVNSVTFQGVNVTVPATSSNAAVTAKAPIVNQELGPADTILNTANSGSSSPTQNDQVQWAYVQPQITAVTPSAAAGSTVTITGQHFGGQVTVTFGGVQAQVTSQSADPTDPTLAHWSLTVIVPNGSGTVPVVVSNPKLDSSPVDFTYAPPTPPTVTGVSPNKGSEAGSTAVTISGTGFVAPATVKFGTADATGVQVVDANTITALSPAGTGTVDVVVTTANGPSATSTADKFTYGPAPTVTALTPASGPAVGGTGVAITGTGFEPTSSVSFGSIPATSVTYVNSTSMLATSPPGSGIVDVTVTNSYGTSSVGPGDRFTYLLDDCGAVTGDYGYLNVGRKNVNGTNDTLIVNIILGLDHTPSIWPSTDPTANNSTVSTLPLDTKCDSSLTGSILDNPPKTYVDGVNCLDVENGNKVSYTGTALLDGDTYTDTITNKQVTVGGRLINPPSGHSTATLYGRDNVDSDTIDKFLNIPIADFASYLNNMNAHKNDTNLVSADILKCPRFMVLPVLHTTPDPANGLYPVQDFVGAFVDTIKTQGGGKTPQTTAILAWTFPLTWLPKTIANPPGTIPYLGTGPVVPALIK